MQNESVPRGWGRSSAAAPRQALREDRKHIANGYLRLRGSAPPSSPYPGLLPLLLSLPGANTTSHLKGTHNLIQIMLITKGAVQFISDPPAMDTVPVTASRSTPPSSFTPDPLPILLGRKAMPKVQLCVLGYQLCSELCHPEPTHQSPKSSI